MNRELKSIARWLTMFMIVVGLLGVLPTAALTQGAATPDAVIDEQTDPPPIEDPVVVPTEMPTEPPVDDPVIVPTEAPTEPPVVEDPVIVPTEEPTEPLFDEGSVDPVASPGAPSLGIQAIEAQQETSSIRVTAVDEGGDDIFNVCYTVFENNGGNQGQFLGQGCDFDDGNDGVTTITGIPAGTHLLGASFVPEGFVVGVQQLVAVVSGETTAVTFEIASGGRTLRIAKVDESGSPLPGTCFNLTKDFGGGQPGNFVAGRCDDQGPGTNDGFIVFTGVSTGEYVLVETTAPQGFVAGPPLAFTMTTGQGNFNLTVENLPIDSPGNLIVNKVDENGDPLTGACFEINEDAGGGQRGNFVANQCDFQIGQLVFPGIAPGSYVLTESHAPDGYINDYRTSVTILGDRATTLTVPNVPGGSNISVRKVDAETGELLTGACFSVHRNDGSGQPGPDTSVEGRCDDSDGSSNGITPFTGLAAGDYLLDEYQAPVGYIASEQFVLFTVDGTSNPTITVENLPLDSPGNLIVNKVDENSAPLGGACFSVFIDEGGGTRGLFITEKCDFDFGTGQSDGQIVISGLEVENYILLESVTPPGYIVGGTHTFAITSEAATVLEIPNARGGATLTVKKVDEIGEPLLDSCFQVRQGPDAFSSEYVAGSCDNQGEGTNDGTIIIQGLPPGDYFLWESFVPTVTFGTRKSPLLSTPRPTISRLRSRTGHSIRRAT